MELAKVSPTDVEGFDPRTTFGCPSKFHFKVVQGIPEIGNASTLLGDEVHAQCEHFLRTGQNGLGKIAEPGLWWLEKVRPHVFAIEQKFGKQDGYRLENLPVTGRIDLLLDYGRARADMPIVRQVHDHKTSSNVAAYGKTEDDLLKNHQTAMYLDYARFKYGWGKQESEMLRMSHGYFQTKGKKLFKPVETFVTVPQLETQIADTRSIVRAMKDVAREPDIRKVDKNLAACDVGHGCPYKTRCPRGVSAMSSLLSRFKKSVSPATPAAPAPAPVAPVVAKPVAPPVAPPPAAVLAPDAPKSDPAKAAQPPKVKKLSVVDVPSPEEQEEALQAVNTPPAPAPTAPAPVAPAAPVAADKKGPGRPRADGTPAQPRATVEFETMTMRHGLTVNLGDHNFAKVEMEISARFQHTKLEEVEKQLGDFCRASVDRQLEEYAKQMDEAATK